MWGYDEQGRRFCQLDLRLLDDGTRLLRRYVHTYEYDGPDAIEISGACREGSLELFPTGAAIRRRKPGPRGGSQRSGSR